jgi:hypothetical protein
MERQDSLFSLRPSNTVHPSPKNKEQRIGLGKRKTSGCKPAMPGKQHASLN